MYEAPFSHIYNEFGWNTYAEMIAEQLLEWIRINEIKAESVLDIGCGTGVLCSALCEAGMEAVGVDMSEHMLRLARLNCPQAKFICADMTRYEPGRSFDLVTSTGDAINHILDMEDVRRVFANIKRCLKPGGAFVFDIMAYSDLRDGDSFEMADGVNTNAQFTIERKREELIEMHISVSTENGENESETVTELIHDPDELKRLLEEEGFQRVEMTEQLLPGRKHPSGAMFFIAFADRS